MNFSPEEAIQLHEGHLLALLATRVGGAGRRRSALYRDLSAERSQSGQSSGHPGQYPGRDAAGFCHRSRVQYLVLCPFAKTPGSRLVWGQKTTCSAITSLPFHGQIKIVGSVRSKHFAVPVIDIDGPGELARVEALLTEAAERLKPTKHVAPDAKVWFRGQTRGFLLRRTPLVSRFLSGREQVDEPLPRREPRRGGDGTIFACIRSFRRCCRN